jgi:hypothetical protein
VDLVGRVLIGCFKAPEEVDLLRLIVKTTK